MKVKIIKSSSDFDKEWKKHIGKIYDAQKDKYGDYWLTIKGEETFWRPEEVEEV